MIAEPLRRYLESHHATYHVHEHARCFTAAEVAQAAHVPGKQFAKTVLLRVHDRPPGRSILAVLPATEQVDFVRLHRALGFSVELAGEDAFQSVFPSYEPGAAPPIGELAVQDVPVFVESSLARSEGIAFCGGTHTDVVEMPWSEFQRISAHKIFDFGRPTEPAAPTSRSSS